MNSRLLNLAYSLQTVYLRLRKPLTIGVRAYVADQEGRVLLVRHTYRPGWFLPGGGVEKKESLEEAVARELWEEVGVRPIQRPQLFHVYSNFREYRSDHVALFRLSDYTQTPNPNREIAESGYFSIDDLPAETTEATRNRIAEVHGVRQPGPLW